MIRSLLCFLFALLITLPQSSKAQSAQSRTLDFANLKECYQKTYHTTPKQNALPSLPSIRFVEGARVNKDLKVTVNALVIQQPIAKQPDHTKITVIQQRPYLEPGFIDKALGKLVNKPFKQKEEFVSQTFVTRSNLITNNDCQSDVRNVRVPIASSCTKDSKECVPVALSIQSELKTVDGHRRPSLCVPKIVTSKKKVANTPANAKELELTAKKALIAQFDYMADNYVEIVKTTIGPLEGAYSGGSKNPAIVEFKRFTTNLRSALRADQPTGACQKIFIDPDPELQRAARRLFCLAAVRTDDDCNSGTDQDGGQGVKNGETL